jgi:acetate kinase
MKCLIPNIGSTSFKFRLLEMPGGRVLASGRVERIGQAGGECADYPAAIRSCIDGLVGEGKPLSSLGEIQAVGFKAVHAGELTDPQLIGDEFLAELEEFAFLCPAHNPPYLDAIRAFRQELPGVPLVAVLETSPYRWMDEAATTYAIPYEWRTKFGIRRYGFHGASHRAANERTSAVLGRNDLRHISCHLGGSSSLAAFRNGIAVDTSFGASPQSGLPQNNRAGDVDVFAVLYMMKKLGLGPDEMARLLGSKSGLAGISGTSGDLRDLEEAAAAGNHAAQLALDVFVRAIRHYLGAFLVSLGGVDVITFSGGIGENGAAIRAGALNDLSGLGILLDPERNRTVAGEGFISAQASQVAILVIPANEEFIVARETVAVIERSRACMEALASHAS